MSRRVQISRDVVRQSIHHLTQYLSFVVPMSRRAEAECRNRGEILASRTTFKTLFVEIQGCLGALVEALDEEAVSPQVQKAIDDVKALPAWKRVMDVNDARDREFKKIRPSESTNHPGATCFEVELTRDCSVFGDWLLGRVAFVDGQPWYVLGVEWSPLLAAPFRTGTPIKLVVRSIEEMRAAKAAQVQKLSEGENGEACPDRPAQGPHDGGGQGAADAH